MKAFLMNVAFWLKWIMIAPDGSFGKNKIFFFLKRCQWDSVSKCRVSPVLTNRTMFIFSRDAKSWLFIAFCTSTNALVNCHILVQYSEQFVGWEPEGHYPCSTMFRWEPEGRYCHRLCTAIAPFWLSAKSLFNDWTSLNSALLAPNWWIYNGTMKSPSSYEPCVSCANHL